MSYEEIKLPDRDFELLRELVKPPKTVSTCVQEILDKENATVDDRVEGSKMVVDNLSLEDLFGLKEQFKKYYRGMMNRNQLREWLEYYNPKLQFSDEEFEILFLKIDHNNLGLVTWDEFISYLLLEYHEKDNLQSKDDLVLEEVIKGLPKVLKSYHRHAVLRVAFNPVITKDRVASYLIGKYVTVSKDGVIHMWSLNMDLEQTMRSVNRMPPKIGTPIDSLKAAKIYKTLVKRIEISVDGLVTFSE